LRRRLRKLDKSTKAFYVYDEELESLGISHRITDGDDIFCYNEDVYLRQGVDNYIASIRTVVDGNIVNVVIRSVADLMDVLKRDAPGEWIFRGQRSCRWGLLAGIFRSPSANAKALVSDEKQIFHISTQGQSVPPCSANLRVGVAYFSSALWTAHQVIGLDGKSTSRSIFCH
jgi:hypothetical protein